MSCLYCTGELVATTLGYICVGCGATQGIKVWFFPPKRKR